MRFVKQSTLFAILVAGTSTMFVVSDTAIAQQSGQGGSSVRPTDDLPLAPKSEPIEPGSSGDSLTAGPMPSQFAGLTKDTVIWPTRTFAIPVKVETIGNSPIDVQLFVARGPGNQWRMIDRKPSTVTEFPFEAADDGLYWFATRTIRSAGDEATKPHVTQAIAPQLKIFVDSTLPDVTISADADASGRVAAQVSLDDATPLRSIQLHYVTDTLRQWQSLDVNQMNANGSLTFQPGVSWQQLSLQAVVIDSAGNQRVVSKLLQRPRIAAYAPGQQDPHQPAMTSQTAQYRTEQQESDSQPLEIRTVAAPIDTTDDEESEQPSERIAANPYRSQTLLNGYRGAPVKANPYGLPAGGVPPSLSALNQPMTAPVTAPVPTPVQSNTQPAWQSQAAWQSPALPSPASPDEVTNGFTDDFAGPMTSAAPTTPAASGAIVPAKPSGISETPPRPRTIVDAMRPISDKPTSLDKPTKSIETIPTPQGARRDRSDGPEDAEPYATRKLSPPEFDLQMWGGRVPTRYSDSFRFSLDYELEAVGANGAKAIELWASTDGGKNWDRWGSDPDLASPFDIETKDEGVFGFRIVVVGHNGLTTPRPLPGETPDIVIVVDKVNPDVRITGASYGEGDRIGSLVIRYACTDPNLMQRPITLAFSDAPDGPWTTIAAGLQNDGDYVWPADPQLPRRLYLRIDATDRAGNVGSYVLDRAIDAQGLAPRARIRGFQTLGGAPQPASDQQTAERPTATFK